MQAITTKYLPYTDTKPSRIKASCERGSLTVSCGRLETLIEIEGDAPGDESCHAKAARMLADGFVDEDVLKYDSRHESNPWARPLVSGYQKSGVYVHVFQSKK